MRVLQPCAGAPNRFRYRLHRLALANHPLGEFVFHAQQLFALAFQHLVYRDAGPARDDMGDVVRRDHLFHHAALAVLCLGLFQLLLKLGDLAIGQFAGALELALTLGDRKFVACLVKLSLEIGSLTQLRLLGLPLCGQRCRLFLKIGQLLFQSGKPVPGCFVRFDLERFPLDLELHDAAVDLIQRFRLGIHLHAQPRGGLVHQVDCLVGQETIGNVAV